MKCKHCDAEAASVETTTRHVTDSEGKPTGEQSPISRVKCSSCKRATNWSDHGARGEQALADWDAGKFAEQK